MGSSGRYDGECIGGIICLWNDVRVADKNLLVPHNGLAGGVLPFSERAWCGPAEYRAEYAGVPAKMPFMCRLTRKIHGDSDTTRYFKIGFEAPARSNRISDGVASQGEWPNFGSISVNGISIAPPVWNEPNTYRYHYNTWARPEEELPYTDEQLYWMRAPAAVALHKGENEVVIWKLFRRGHDRDINRQVYK